MTDQTYKGETAPFGQEPVREAIHETVGCAEEPTAEENGSKNRNRAGLCISAYPGMSLSMKNEIICIFRSTVSALGTPKAVRFLFKPETCELAIQSCSARNRDGISVPDLEADYASFRINSINVLRMIWNCCGWKDDETYRVHGLFHPSYNLVHYDLRKAERISESQVFEDEELDAGLFLTAEQK